MFVKKEEKRKKKRLNAGKTRYSGCGGKNSEQNRKEKGAIRKVYMEKRCVWVDGFHWSMIRPFIREREGERKSISEEKSDEKRMRHFV